MAVKEAVRPYHRSGRSRNPPKADRPPSPQCHPEPDTALLFCEGLVWPGKELWHNPAVQLDSCDRVRSLGLPAGGPARPARLGQMPEHRRKPDQRSGRPGIRRNSPDRKEQLGPLRAESGESQGVSDRLLPRLRPGRDPAVLGSGRRVVGCLRFRILLIP